ncbi:MAG: SpoIIE family protein phosphatase [Ruminococcus sp.]|uniref:SpoIIE family protein phosphatase n=1 Tax=Ruminococcus sp. TaxID=41978 RepID=UPI0025D34CAE|nr:SpoIIE family protein phosphatase [Ruminococcus sp.]MCR5541437.1 SpoIIE family protein phosphatase [Ruminococcus sp.]
MLQNVKTNAVKTAEKRRISKGTATARKWSCRIGAFAGGLLTGLSVTLGFPSFMCGAAASLAGDYSPAVFLGTLLAFLLNRGIEAGIVQICSVLVITAIHFIDPFGERRNEPVYRSLVVSGVLMLFSCVVTAAVPSDFYLASMRMINSLLAGCTVFITMTVRDAAKHSGVFDLTGMNGMFAGMFFIMMVSIFASVNIFAVNPGRMLGAFILLQASRRYRSFGGAVIGALTACGVLVSDPSLARNTLLLATAGLICGVFIRFGKLAAVMSFLVTSLISLVAVGVNGDTYHMFADIVTGSLLFLIIPAEKVKRISKHISGFQSTPELIGHTTAARLSMAGRTLGEIRRRLDMVTVTMDRNTASRKASSEVRRCVCSDCHSYHLCFEKNENTEKAFDILQSTLDRGDSVTDEQVKQTVLCCDRPQLLSNAFNDLERHIIADKAENIRIRELRTMLTDQLLSMEDILSDLSYRSSQVQSIDTGLSESVREQLAFMGYKGAKVCVYIDEDLCRRADAFIKGSFSGDVARLTASVSSILDCDMALPDITEENGMTRISFSELPCFTAEAAVFSASASGEYSGDSYDIFDVGGSEKYILLSDGMGTGKRARLDSSFTVSLSRKLLTSGLSLTTVHRLVSSMLRVKGWEESFATMDILHLDLCGGRASLLKAGAVNSRLCRDGAVVPLGDTSLPAGILSDCPPDKCEIKLFDGDIIIMNSDGADEDSAQLIAQTAAAETNCDMTELVNNLGSMILERRQGARADDITVIAVRIGLRKD